jgi:DNA-binding response OmpR family regulator
MRKYNKSEKWRVKTDVSLHAIFNVIYKMCTLKRNDLFKKEAVIFPFRIRKWKYLLILLLVKFILEKENIKGVVFMYKILLIEDDPQLCELIQSNLERYGYGVELPVHFSKIEEEFTRINPDLVLLDINLPYYDGYYLCRSFRQKSTVPILMISARSQEMEQIMALELGADDFITKPFTFDMLHTKIKATLRRVYGEYSAKEENQNCVGSLCLDDKSLILEYEGSRVELSKNEYKLMKKLMEQHGTFVSREELIEEVWDAVTFVDDNTLTVNMTRIKQTLAELGLSQVIKSKRGVGYMLQNPARIEHG